MSQLEDTSHEEEVSDSEDMPSLDGTPPQNVMLPQNDIPQLDDMSQLEDVSQAEEWFETPGVAPTPLHIAAMMGISDQYIRLLHTSGQRFIVYPRRGMNGRVVVYSGQRHELTSKQRLREFLQHWPDSPAHGNKKESGVQYNSMSMLSNVATHVFVRHFVELIESPGLQARNLTIGTGRLLIEGESRILLETPLYTSPYVHLLLAKATPSNGSEQRVRLFCASNDPDYNVDLAFKTLRHRLAHDTVDPFAGLVVHYVGKYVDHVITKSTRIKEKIDTVEQLTRGPRECKLSKLLIKLSEYKYNIRSSKLDEQVAFCADAAKWADQILERAPNYADRALSLLYKIQGGHESNPDRLRGRIEDLRVFIADLVTEEKQEEEERLQLKAQERERKEEERYNQRLVEEATKEKRDQSRQRRKDEKEKERDRREKEWQKREDKRRKKKKEQEDHEDAFRKDRDEYEERLQKIRDKIMLETRQDGRTMRGIAVVTMAFLPATFVSSFFGMNFFNGIAGPVPFDAASRNVWIFFLVALPVSAVVLVVFFWWDKNAEKNDQADRNKDRTDGGRDKIAKSNDPLPQNPGRTEGEIDRVSARSTQSSRVDGEVGIELDGLPSTTAGAGANSNTSARESDVGASARASLRGGHSAENMV